ncbi:hypothetical protein POCGH01_00062500 [Plasmodium ovale]|nr:hypothetical protein POVCU1_056320 [Plasmodium ovale curtisi]SBT85056.1 hypothetical protein POCGH01_00062500 [Plasmodium ovale]
MAKSCQTRDMRMLFDYGDGISTYGSEETINYIGEDLHNEQLDHVDLRSELSENINNKHSYEEENYSSQHRNNEIHYEDEDDYFGYIKKQSKKLKLDKTNIKKIMKSPKAIISIITTGIVLYACPKVIVPILILLAIFGAGITLRYKLLPRLDKRYRGKF